jgi:hypothetical protein
VLINKEKLPVGLKIAGAHTNDWISGDIWGNPFEQLFEERNILVLPI